MPLSRQLAERLLFTKKGFRSDCKLNKLEMQGGEPRELLVEKFSELVKKMWNPRNFKGHVSPHEALQAVAVASDKKFRIDKQADQIPRADTEHTNTLRQQQRHNKRKQMTLHSLQHVVARCLQSV